jgi:pyruvate-formate lyase
MKQYFLNYSKLAEEMLKNLGPKEEASKKSLTTIRDTMARIACYPPEPYKKGEPEEKRIRGLHQGAQIILSTFICLHLTGEPVSIGRVDYLLRQWAKPIDPKATTVVIAQEEQDIIDSFWIKVGEKANFNKGFFEDHQKWGNLAMGGNSAPYPQGASFNQWGHQLTAGGTNPDGSPFYNSLTIACLRASRTIPVNAPCLGLRVQTKTPKIILEEAAKTALAGGAHPIIINDDKVIAGFKRCSSYKICPELWKNTPIEVNGEKVDVPYELYSPEIEHDDMYDFSSDGCHEYLMVGKTWFWLGGGSAL